MPRLFVHTLRIASITIRNAGKGRPRPFSGGSALILTITLQEVSRLDEPVDSQLGDGSNSVLLPLWKF